MTTLYARTTADGAVELFTDSTLRHRIERYEPFRTDLPRPSDSHLVCNLQVFVLHWITV